MLTRRSRAPKHVHYTEKPKRRVPVRLVLAALLVLVVLAGAATIRAETMSGPELAVHRVLPASVKLSGSAPKLAWPATGQAAVEVQGLPPIGTSGPETPVPIASIAKVMTALLILKDHPLAPGQAGFTLTVTPADVSDYQSRLAQAQSVVPVSAGESLNELQLLQGLLIGSGNNLAAMLAAHDAGSVTAFVAKMNSAARSLGMNHTTYTDPSGLADTTVSTAPDQLKLAGIAMANPVFAQIVAMPKVNLPVAGMVDNFNRAVGTGGYIGIKTGSTSIAGGNLMFANRQVVDGHVFTILGVVLGQDVGQVATSTLMTAALHAANALVLSVKSSLTNHTVLPAGTSIAVVTNGSGGRVNVATTQALSTVGFGGMAVPLSMNVSPVGRHLSSGQAVASVGLANDHTEHATGAAMSTMPDPSWTWQVKHLF